MSDPIVRPIAGAGAPAGSINEEYDGRTRPFRHLDPTDHQQCHYPSASMLNMGGCTYGSPEDRAEWRGRRMGILKPSMDPAYCSRRAKYDVAGDPYCPLHAGQAALVVCLAMVLE